MAGERSNTCECVSLNCENEEHSELECDDVGWNQVQSRDFGDEVFMFCPACGISAMRSGIFKEPANE